MNKWQKAGDKAGFRANQAIWRELAPPSEKGAFWIARLKAPAKNLERTLRRALWRRTKKYNLG
jgi:hypothetical protein